MSGYAHESPIIHAIYGVCSDLRSVKEKAIELATAQKHAGKFPHSEDVKMFYVPEVSYGILEQIVGREKVISFSSS